MEVEEEVDNDEDDDKEGVGDPETFNKYKKEERHPQTVLYWSLTSYIVEVKSNATSLPFLLSSRDNYQY